MTNRGGRQRSLPVGSCIVAAAAGLFGACAEPPPLPPRLEEADPALAALIDENDSIDGVAPRWTAFANGERVRYWHLGRQTATPMIAYQPCVEAERGCEALSHPPVVEHLPGEEGYSPYLRLHELRVPAGWTGRLRSVEEVEAAIASGEVAPMETGRYLHCPIAASDAQLDVGPDATALAERAIWVRGMEARCFDLSQDRERPLYSDGTMIVRNVYSLTRDGETDPIHEGRRMADLTGDGDQLDSNNILGVGLRDGDYTPLWRVVRVTVPADYESIDTSMDDGLAEYTSATDMFEIGPDYELTPIEGRVLGFELTDVLFDCPIQSAEGQL
ncbi:MAG: hypothetical protein M5U28_30145 [Sandaracinaceae bacterium]|nr:hypothetical protein [Sandaracinaceae bacterium]